MTAKDAANSVSDTANRLTNALTETLTDSSHSLAQSRAKSADCLANAVCQTAEEAAPTSLLRRGLLRGHCLLHGRLLHGRLLHGRLLHGRLLHGRLRHGRLLHGRLRHGRLRHGLLRHGLLRHGLLRHLGWLLRNSRLIAGRAAEHTPRQSAHSLAKAALTLLVAQHSACQAADSLVNAALALLRRHWLLDGLRRLSWLRYLGWLRRLNGSRLRSHLLGLGWLCPLIRLWRCRLCHLIRWHFLHILIALRQTLIGHELLLIESPALQRRVSSSMRMSTPRCRNLPATRSNRSATRSCPAMPRAGGSHVLYPWPSDVRSRRPPGSHGLYNYIVCGNRLMVHEAGDGKEPPTRQHYRRPCASCGPSGWHTSCSPISRVAAERMERAELANEFGPTNQVGAGGRKVSDRVATIPEATALTLGVWK